MRRVLLWARSNEDSRWVAAATALAKRQWPALRPTMSNGSAFDPRDDLQPAGAVVVQPGQDAIASAYRAAGTEVVVFTGATGPPSSVVASPPGRVVPLAPSPAPCGGQPVRRRRVG